MTEYYLDASALVKRYANEPGSTRIRQITNRETQHTILLAEIILSEVAAALAAKHRVPGGLTAPQRERALSRFLENCDAHFLLLPVDRPVIDRAVVLTQKHRLRGYDAVQLATALVTRETLEQQNLSAPIFVASDHDLRVSATASTHSRHGRRRHMPFAMPLRTADLVVR